MWLKLERADQEGCDIKDIKRGQDNRLRSSGLADHCYYILASREDGMGCSVWSTELDYQLHELISQTPTYAHKQYNSLHMKSGLVK